uniref:Uncharacterized protein n=1 Tax=Triticum urartu TaxID=4572 RepID=A0A8R7P0N1_TRIUA
MGWKGVLGFDYGVVQAPLGPDISGPELAAAVANAGAIGLLRLPDWSAPDHVRELIRRTRSLTEKPFGAAIVLAFPHEENLRVVLEEKLAVLQVYWGEFPKERVDEAHRAGVKVLHQDCWDHGVICNIDEQLGLASDVDYSGFNELLVGAKKFTISGNA